MHKQTFMFAQFVMEDKCASYITEELNGSICTNNIFHSLDLCVIILHVFYVIDPIQKVVKTP